MSRVDTIDGPPTTDALLERLPQLQRLARGLVRDVADADDLVQSAVEVALRRPPELRAAWRSWLARVVTNLARQHARTDGRRTSRERAVSTREAIDATDALVERHDIRLRLMQAVRGLHEPYREAILLRFFEDLPPRAIAARLGAPVKTIDSRIARGLAKLRERLDTDHGGDRRAWALAMLPLVKVVRAPLTLAGVLAMKSVTITIGVATLLCTSWWMLHDEPAPPPTTTVAVHDEPPADPVAPSPSTPIERTATTPQTSPDPREPTAPIQLPTHAGRVLDVEGQPVPGVRLAVSQGDDATPGFVTNSDGDGRFTLQVAQVAREVAVIDPRYTTVLQAAIAATDGETPPPDVHVIVAAVTQVRGIAVDANGLPVAGASIELAPPVALRARFPFDLRDTRTRSLDARTDAAGRFAFDTAAAVLGSTLSATKVGYDGASRVLDEFPSTDVRLTLTRPNNLATLDGIAYAPDGNPLADAFLALGTLPARTGADGRFSIEYPRAEPPDRLFAVARGLRALTLDRPDPQWPPFVELRFRDPAPSIAGVVYGANGDPQPGARVWIDRPTVFGQSNGNFWLAECLTSGSTAMQHGTTADEHGRFRIEGLVDREYGLCAMIPELAWQIDAGRANAGDERVEIRFPQSGLHASIHGRVVDAHGAGVPEASVYVMTMVLAAEDPVSSQRFYNGANGSSTTTDASGHFVLEHVPVGSELNVGGDGIDLDPPWPVPATLTEPITLQVARVCSFRVELAAIPNGATSVALRDALDREVSMTRSTPERIEMLQRAPLDDGRSERLTTLDRAVTMIVLDAQRKELARVAITLDPSVLNVLR